MQPGATSTPLRLRQRTDLQFYPQNGRDGRIWVVKDPLSLCYFQFQEEEFQLLRWLDGRSDLNELINRFETRFAPRRLTRPRLLAFVTKLHRSGLVLSDAVGQGQQLILRGERQRSQQLLSAACNPLAIRLPGVDPSRFLDWLLPKTRWLFSHRVLWVCGLFVAGVLAWITLYWEHVYARFPDGHLLIRPANVVLLATVLAVTKILHEFGHALACRYHGAECHRMGVMLLLFTPCLYCDVSDAWTLEQRWKRIAVTSSGMLVELFLAAVCTVLWWSSRPGIANTIFFNVMLVCSLGTVLINANPLMRYDGYYLLSDALRFPNLWQQSSERLRGWLWKACFGIASDRRNESFRRTAWLIVYKILSLTYRIFVVTAIVYLAHQILKPHGLETLAFLLTASVVIGFVSGPVKSVYRTVSDPLFRRRIDRRRTLCTGVWTAALLAGFFFMPLPRRVSAPVSFEAKDAKQIYVSVPGRLRTAVAAGTVVRRGDTLARLENLSLQRQLESVQGQVLLQRQRIRSLQSLRSLRSQYADQLPAAQEVLDDLLVRQGQLENEVAALKLTAPIDGIVIEPPRTRKVETVDGQLSGWSGTPLEPYNRGASLERQTLLCSVGAFNSHQAIAYIHQSDISDVRTGQSVELRLQLDGWRSVRGRVRQVALAKTDTVPTELAFDGQLANQPDADGVARPDETWYQAQIEVTESEFPLLIGARGTAKIDVAAEPLGIRLWRFLQRTFKPVI